VVDKVLMFRQLSPSQKTSADASYVQIGSGNQRYLVKRIDSRPDFDHIVAYTAASGASTATITLGKQALQQPDARALAAALHVPAGAIRGTVYFSTDDLK
jgi:hypothetical protein